MVRERSIDGVVRQDRSLTGTVRCHSATLEERSSDLSMVLFSSKNCSRGKIGMLAFAGAQC